MKEGKLAISINELSEFLGIGRTLCYRLSRQDGFPVVKIGKRRIIPLSQLEEWLRSNTWRVQKH